MKRPFYMSLLFRVFLCVSAFCVCSYKYLDQQNAITKKRLAIPLIAGQVKVLKEQNMCLQYKVQCFESPEHLMRLAKRPSFAHLKSPKFNEVIALQEVKAPSISDPTLAQKESSGLSSALVGTRY